MENKKDCSFSEEEKIFSTKYEFNNAKHNLNKDEKEIKQIKRKYFFNFRGII